MGLRGVDFMWQMGVWKYQIVGHICGGNHYGSILLPAMRDIDEGYLLVSDMRGFH